MADTREVGLRRRMTIPEHESDHISPSLSDARRNYVEYVQSRGRSLSTTIPLMIGRTVLGGYFLYNGINHFRNRRMLTDYARAKGVPAAELAVPISGLMILAGGLSVLSGARPKLGASLMAAFLLGVSPQMHAFWKETEPERQMQEGINFLKNMALVGGAMFVAAVPEPWPYRVDRGALPSAS